MKAVIYDCDLDRRNLFEGVFGENTGWECKAYGEVFKTPNNWIHPPEDVNLILLHLRGPNATTGGNQASWDFLIKVIANMARAKEIFLFAYTGGSAKEPKVFTKMREEKYSYWAYFAKVSRPNDIINLNKFVDAWKVAPDAGPPLHLVCPPLQQVEVNKQITALKILISGYQSAHSCCISNDTSCHGKDNSTEALHAWTESPDCWLTVLGEDMIGAQALIKVLDNHDLKNLISKLAEFFNSPNKTNVFPHAALCTFSSGNKSAA